MSEIAKRRKRHSYEFLRLLKTDSAIRTGVGQVRKDASGIILPEPIPYARVQFAYPGRTLQVTVTFTEKRFAYEFKESLLERLWQARSDEQYNKVVYAFLDKLKEENPDIPIHGHGEGETLLRKTTDKDIIV